MEQNGVERSIGRIEGKLDQVVVQMTSLKTSFDALEAGRLTKIESKVANQEGRLTILAIIGSAFVSVALYLIEHLLVK